MTGMDSIPVFVHRRAGSVFERILTIRYDSFHLFKNSVFHFCTGGRIAPGKKSFFGISSSLFLYRDCLRFPHIFITLLLRGRIVDSEAGFIFLESKGLYVSGCFCKAGG